MDIPMVLGMSMESERPNLLLNLKQILKLILTCCMVDSMDIVVIMDIPMVLGMSMESERPNLLLNLKLIPRLIPTCCMVDFMVMADIMDIPMVTELGMSMERERPNLLLHLKLIPRLIPTCCMEDIMVLDTMDMPMVSMATEDIISASKGRGTTKFTLLFEQRLKSKQHGSISLCIAMIYNKFLLPVKV